MVIKLFIINTTPLPKLDTDTTTKFQDLRFSSPPPAAAAAGAAAAAAPPPDGMEASFD